MSVDLLFMRFFGYWKISSPWSRTVALSKRTVLFLFCGLEPYGFSLASRLGSCSCFAGSSTGRPQPWSRTEASVWWGIIGSVLFLCSQTQRACIYASFQGVDTARLKGGCHDPDFLSIGGPVNYITQSPSLTPLFLPNQSRNTFRSYMCFVISAKPQHLFPLLQ